MRFILTEELGRLARWLRLFGYDAVYFNSDNMKRLFVDAFNEARIIITKRKRISDGKTVKIIYLKGDLLKEQISELRKKIKLNLSNRTLFTRCADCNKEVFKINKGSTRGLVPPYVFKTQKRFFQCPACARIFWKATHWDRAQEFIDEIRS